MNFDDLYKNSWSGAIDTLNRIQDENKEDELMEFLEEQFQDVPTETEVNDFLWFESEYIYESLGISDEEEEEEESEEE